MTITGEQAIATLQFLIPGFVLMKVFYAFGLRTQRSDAQLVLWSILATVPIATIAQTFEPNQSGQRLLLALATAVAVGAFLSIMWWLLTKWQPEFAFDAATHAWDVIFSASRWVQVETTDHHVFTGQARFAARSIDTDDQDLYIIQPRVVVDPKEGLEEDLPNVEGLLISRSQIAHLAVLKPVPRRTN